MARPLQNPRTVIRTAASAVNVHAPAASSGGVVSRSRVGDQCWLLWTESGSHGCGGGEGNDPAEREQRECGVHRRRGPSTKVLRTEEIEALHPVVKARSSRGELRARRRRRLAVGARACQSTAHPRRPPLLGAVSIRRTASADWQHRAHGFRHQREEVGQDQ